MGYLTPELGRSSIEWMRSIVHISTIGQTHDQGGHTQGLESAHSSALPEYKRGWLRELAGRRESEADARRLAVTLRPRDGDLSDLWEMEAKIGPPVRPRAAAAEVGALLG
jgi:hypothetical protein